MMSCLIGKIVSIGNKVAEIEDTLTSQIYSCRTTGEEFLELKEGDEGVFLGEFYNNQLTIQKIEIRKFLDPLYEADLYDASGAFTMVSVIDDPFIDIYREFKEQQILVDEDLIEEFID